MYLKRYNMKIGYDVETCEIFLIKTHGISIKCVKIYIFIFKTCKFRPRF